MLRFLLLFLPFLVFLPSLAEAAILTVGPSVGTFTVGSTFEVSIFLDTEGESINALDIGLLFPPDKLQVVSPSAGRSIVGVWTSPPRFNNQSGEITLQGGIPKGINVQAGLISTVTFRVRQVGQAVLKFKDDSKVLLNDGKGTEVLRNTQGGVYNFVLPPPAGPIVASETHPDQSSWYPNPTAVLEWSTDQAVQGFSHVLNKKPVDLPDDISEGFSQTVSYKNLESGIHYFHIKALRGGAWGGVTNFAVNIDNEPPADFMVEISPSNLTTNNHPIISFSTTDIHSGINHYEYKVVRLNPPKEANAQVEKADFFIEAPSTSQVLSLERGKYDVIVRAYDKAGNIKESVGVLRITSPLLKWVYNIWFWVILAVIIGLGILGAWFSKKWHHSIEFKRKKKELPEAVKKQLRELKMYREKYGKALILLLILSALWFPFSGDAQERDIGLTPPVITSASNNISNEEIFYIGGRTDVAGAEVIIYLQNLNSGETLSESVTSNKKGDWFYRHSSFLSGGDYVLWAQTKLGEAVSPPTPQVNMRVSPTAIQIGASRFSFETLYLIIAVLLLASVAGLFGFIIFHFRHGHRKRKEFWKEIKEAEESVRRGFAVLRRDLQAELAAVRKINTRDKTALNEAKKRELDLLKDLNDVETRVGKEIWDIEATEHI